MAKKTKEDSNNTFVDSVSGISYQWLKEEVTPANGISCWSARDQWGNKDYFVVKEGAIIRGPFRTVKETVKALEEGVKDDLEDTVEDTEVDAVNVEERANLGIMDELRQASNQVTEVIRRCEGLQQWSEDVGKDEIIEVLQSIIDEENENIGKIQAMLKSLSPENEKIEDGEEKAEEILDNDDVFGNVEDDIFAEGFGITPEIFAQLKAPESIPTKQAPSYSATTNTNTVVTESVEDADINQILQDRYGANDIVDCDIIDF